MFADVQKLVARLNLDARVEYVTDMERIMAYGVMSTPVLVINEKIVMVGYRGAAKIEQALREGGAA
jgi:predicted DsbA family dithiol-disulfide isomerase